MNSSLLARLVQRAFRLVVVCIILCLRWVQGLMAAVSMSAWDVSCCSLVVLDVLILIRLKEWVVLFNWVCMVLSCRCECFVSVICVLSFVVVRRLVASVLMNFEVLSRMMLNLWPFTVVIALWSVLGWWGATVSGSLV